MSKTADEASDDEKAAYWGCVDESSLYISFTLYHVRDSANSTETTMYVGGLNTDNQERGTSVSQCGWSDLPCNSVATVLDMTGSYTSVTLLNSAYTSSDISGSITKALTISGQSKSGADVTLDGNGLTVTIDVSTGTVTLTTMSVTVSSGYFITSASGGTLALTSISFTGSDGMTALTHSLVSTTAGALTLTSVKFHTITVDAQPLVSVSGTTCTIASSSFTSLTRKSGEGGIVDVSIGSGRVSVDNTSFSHCTQEEANKQKAVTLCISIGASSTLSLTSITGSTFFTDCTSGAGSNASAVYVAVSDTPTIFEVKSVTFSTCTVGSTQKNFFILCVDGTAFLKEESWTGTDYATAKSAFWVAEQITSRGAFDIELYYFLRPPSSSESGDGLYVSVAGWDSATCGWVKMPCKTIYTAHTRYGTSGVTSTTPLILLYDGGDTHCAETLGVPITQSITVRTEDSHSFTAVKAVESVTDSKPVFAVSSSATVTFERISF